MRSEPDPKEVSPCQNCGALLRGAYCHACGQKAATHLPTLPEFLLDSAARLVDLDGSIWRSLRQLVASPGTLSVDFLEGRRASIVHPARFFVVVAVVAFALSTFVLNDLEQGGIVYIVTVGLASLVNEDWGQLLILLVAVPAMAAALKVLFLRRGRGYLEHLVITLEFFTLLLLAGTIETLVVMTAYSVTGVSIQLHVGLATLLGLTIAAGLLIKRAYRASLVESAVALVFLVMSAGVVVAFAIDFI